MPTASTADLKSLYDRHSRMILQTAWRITGHREDAEDVLQQVFLRLLGTHSPDTIPTIRGGYLRRAAVNASLDIIRSRKARPDQVSSEGNPGYQVPSSAENPEETLRTRDLAEALLQAVLQLNSRAAEAFILRDIEGLSSEKIAEILGTTPNTVSVTCHRARTRLMEILSSWVGLSNSTGRS